MSSGECAHYSHPPRNMVFDRVKQRMEHCKQHSQDCQDRHMSTQHQRSENDRLATNMLMQKAHDNRAKKTGKYKTQDTGRSKQSSDQGMESRSDDVTRRMLKRKLEVNSVGGNNDGTGAMQKPNNTHNACDSTLPPSGNMPGDFLSSQQFEFATTANIETAKKMKMDSGFFQQQQQQQQPQQQGPSVCQQQGKVSSLSVQIVQQFSNEPQQRIETTVNVNTSINSSSMGNSDGQSVSVNVGSKDIKQEMGQDNNHMSQNTFVSATMGNGQRTQQGEDMGDGLENFPDLIGPDLDLDTLLGDLSQSDDLPGFPVSGTQSQHMGQPQQEGAMAREQQLGQPHVESNHTKEAIFHCKTEKPDFPGFINEQNSEKSSSQDLFNNNNTSDNNRMFPDGSGNGCASNKMSFSHNNSSYQQQSHTSNVTSSNMTSQHIQRLSVSVNSKFNINQQQAQQQVHPMPHSNGQPTTNGSLSAAPKSAPRLSHPTTSLSKSISPSPVSYSVSHQPHPGVNDSNVAVSSFYGAVPRPQMNMHQMPGGMPSSMADNMHRQQRVNMSAPSTQNQMQQSFNPMHHHPSQGMASGLGNQGMPLSDVSRAQQLKELAEKTKRPDMPMMNTWSSNTSTSLNMSSNLSFKGHSHSINQQQHISADMQNFTSFQAPSAAHNSGIQHPSAPQSSNYKEAAAVAHDVLLASRQQQQHNTHATPRLPNYPSESFYQGGIPKSAGGMTTKTMFGQGHMNVNQLQAMQNKQFQNIRSQQMPRNLHRPGDMPNGGLGRNLPGNAFPRQNESGYGQQPILPSGAMVNGSSSINMRVHQAALANSQQSQIVQQKYMVEQYHMNAGHKAGQMTPAGMLRHPIPTGRQNIQYGQQNKQHHSQSLPPNIGSSQMVGGSVNNYMRSAGWNSSSGAHINSAPSNVPPVTLWNNHGVQPQIGNNSNKMMCHSMNMNSNVVPGMHTLSGIHHKMSASNGMCAAGDMSVGNNVSMNQASNTNPINNHPHMTPSGDQQHVFSPVMLPTNNSTISDSGFSLGEGNDSLNGFSESTFPMPNSPNGELNLINDFLDGK